MITETSGGARPTSLCDSVTRRWAATIPLLRRLPQGVVPLQPRVRSDARGSLPPPVHRRPADPHHAPTVRAGSLPARGRRGPVVPGRPLGRRDGPRPRAAPCWRWSGATSATTGATATPGASTSPPRPAGPADRSGLFVQAVRVGRGAGARRVVVRDVPGAVEPALPLEGGGVWDVTNAEGRATAR